MYLPTTKSLVCSNTNSNITLEMAAYAALVSLLNTIDQQIKNHPVLSTSLDIEPLRKKAAGLLLEFIKANNYGGGSKEADELEREIARAAHAAEDVIEFHIVDQIHAPAETSHEASLRCSLDLQQKTQDIDAVMKKANEFKEKQGSREEQPSTHATPVMEIGETTAMVGVEDELDQLLHELTGNEYSRRTISIVGMGGLGKTTLAHNVYEHSYIKKHFTIRARATVSQQYNVEGIFSQLLSGSGTVDDLGDQLYKTLFDRKYLVILDDVWSVEVWDRVRHFFPDNRNGSRVVLTTRSSKVASDCGSFVFNKSLLNEEDSWKLFCDKAFPLNEPCPPELRKAGEEIVKLCKGLPLSIVVVGGRLLKSSSKTLGYWEDVVKDMKLNPNSKDKQESLDVLLSSYNHLPPHLKPCFLYIGILKWHHAKTIGVSKMIKLWVAEGFLKSDDPQVLEEIAEGYLNDLIDRNLILVDKRRDNGKIKSCDIHDLLRDLCLEVGKQQEFVSVIKGGIFQGGGERRRLIFGDSMTESEAPLARSIMAYGVSKEVLDKHRLMRVLDVDGYGSPEELFKSVNLRYLAFKHPGKSFQGPLPLCLQTLIIKGSWSEIVVAPIEIWNMQQLRHLECHQIHVPDPPRTSECILENLQTLKTAVNLRLREEVMIPNIKKLHLLYDRELPGYDDGLFECFRSFNRFTKLETLKLRIKGGKKSSKLTNLLTLPSSLNKLSLRNCRLNWEDLTMIGIGSLPRLEVLRLEIHPDEAMGEWSPVDGEFEQLKFLKIDSCKVARWNAEKAHFPALRNLVLSDVRELIEIPEGIGEISTLKHICVDSCRNSVAISAVKIKEELLTEYGYPDPQIQVIIKTGDFKVFKGLLEKEELTPKDIQLEVYEMKRVIRRIDR